MLCYPKQCRGDINGAEEGSPITGYVAVGPADLAIFGASWSIKEPPKGDGILGTPGASICADLDHDDEGTPITGYVRVGPADIAILAAHWSIKEPTHGPGIPGDCGGTVNP